MSPHTMRMTLYESEQRYKVGELVTFEPKAESITGTYEVLSFTVRVISDKGPDIYRWVYSLRKVKP